MRSKDRKRIAVKLAVTAFSLFSFHSACGAQSTPSSGEEDVTDRSTRGFTTVDENGVNLLTGKPSIDYNLKTIGSGFGSKRIPVGFSYIRRIPIFPFVGCYSCNYPRPLDFSRTLSFYNSLSFLGYRKTVTDIFTTKSFVTPVGSSTMSAPDRSVVTQPDGTAYYTGSGPSKGAIIEYAGVSRYYTSDRSEIVFSDLHRFSDGSQNPDVSISDSYFIDHIIMQNGEVWQYYYDDIGYNADVGGLDRKLSRVRSIVSSRGYGIHVNYMANNIGQATSDELYNWIMPGALYFYNKSISYCDEPGAQDCSASQGSKLITAITYDSAGKAISLSPVDEQPIKMTFGNWADSGSYISYDSSLKTVENPNIAGSAVSYTFQYNGGDPENGPITGEGPSNPAVHYISSVSKDNRTWSYEYDTDDLGVAPFKGKMAVTQPNGSKRYFEGPLSIGIPTVSRDGLNRVSLASFSPTPDGEDPFQYIIRPTDYLKTQVSPEGNTTTFYSDKRGNVFKTEYSQKLGAGPVQTETASFNYDCANILICNMPNWQVDKNGGVTDFTYDASGNKLLELFPVVDGIRKGNNYTYGQRFAWISDGGGGFKHADTSITLLTQKRTCATTQVTLGSCSGGPGDEILTTYDYGPDAGPNNLFVRGVLVVAGGVTRLTCYTYDAQGNQISETKPRSGVTTCP